MDHTADAGGAAWPRARGISARSAAWCAGLALLAGACQQPVQRPGKPTDTTPPRSNAAAVATAANRDDAVKPIAPPVLADDPDRWLEVERVRNGAEGGWATGEFDAKRNKLIIRFRDVDRFLVRTDRVPIDWHRVVILSLNGRNSELVKRDFTVYHFQRDSSGRWVVDER